MFVLDYNLSQDENYSEMNKINASKGAAATLVQSYSCVLSYGSTSSRSLRSHEMWALCPLRFVFQICFQYRVENCSETEATLARCMFVIVPFLMKDARIRF